MNNPWSKFGKSKPDVDKPIQVEMKYKQHNGMSILLDGQFDGEYLLRPNRKKIGMEPWDEWRYI